MFSWFNFWEVKWKQIQKKYAIKFNYVILVLLMMLLLFILPMEVRATPLECNTTCYTTDQTEKLCLYLPQTLLSELNFVSQVHNSSFIGLARWGGLWKNMCFMSADRGTPRYFQYFNIFFLTSAGKSDPLHFMRITQETKLLLSFCYHLKPMFKAALYFIISPRAKKHLHIYCAHSGRTLPENIHSLTRSLGVHDFTLSELFLLYLRTKAIQHVWDTDINKNCAVNVAKASPEI